jgi:hypothetical protein
VFTRQTPNIYESLLRGGVAGPQASALANFLGQCRSELEHRGPVSFDLSRPQMRQITPELAKYAFPGLQLPTPLVLPRRPGPPPDEPPPEEFVDELQPVAEEPEDEGKFQDVLDSRYFPGDFITIDQQRRIIDLRADSRRRHATMFRAPGGRSAIQSVDFDANSNRREYIDLRIAEGQELTRFDLLVSRLDKTYYVSGIDTESDAPNAIANFSEAHVFEPTRRPDLDMTIPIPQPVRQVRLATAEGPWECMTAKDLDFADESLDPGDSPSKAFNVINLIYFPAEPATYKVFLGLIPYNIIDEVAEETWYVIGRAPFDCCQGESLEEYQLPGMSSSELASSPNGPQDIKDEDIVDDKDGVQVLVNDRGCARWLGLTKAKLVEKLKVNDSGTALEWVWKEYYVFPSSLGEEPHSLPFTECPEEDSGPSPDPEPDPDPSPGPY